MNILDDITLLTCTFNNNLLTKCMIMSCYKQLKKEIPIVIMDNGTTELCSSDLKEMFNVIDNSNYQLTKNYNQISRNHCASIDYAIKNLIHTKYMILCDNDILYNSNITKLIEELNKNDEIDCCGEIELHNKLKYPFRLLPFFCIINVDKMKQQNINYFDENRCMNQLDTNFDNNGNWKNNIIKDNKEYGDTGSSFLWDIQDKKWNIKNIKINNYIKHYAMASWNPQVKFNIPKWLSQNKDLFM